MAQTADRIDPTSAQSVSVKGRKRDPVLASSFRVIIEDLDTDYGVANAQTPNVVGFSKISGIGSEIETEEVVQGTSPVALHVPKRIKYSDAEFVRGITTARTGLNLMQWYRDINALMFSGRATGPADRAGDYDLNERIVRIKRRQITIFLPSYEVALVEAFPIAASFGDLDANASSLWIYTMRIRYSGIRVRLRDITPEGRDAGVNNPDVIA